MTVGSDPSAERALGVRPVQAAVIIVLTVIVGGYLRLGDLGTEPFRTDELFHHYAAASLTEGGQPTLPSGRRYERGINYTRLVSVSQNLVEDPEAAARLPAAALGILTLLVLAMATWTMAGPWAAVLATMFLTFYPEHLFLSRFARFYTLQLLLGIGALLTCWLALRHVRTAQRPGRKDAARSWGWLLLTAVLLAGAVTVQLTTLTVVLAAAVAVGIAALTNVFRFGLRAWRGNAPLQVLTVLVALAVVLIAARPGSLATAAFMADFVPAWARRFPQPVLTYYYDLDGAFPALVALSPALYLVVFRRSPWLAVYLLVWFAVPMAIHSFLLEWKAPRYAILAIPGLFVAGGVGVAEAFGSLRQIVEERLDRWFPWRWARVVSTTAVAASLLFAFVGQPAVKDLPERRASETGVDWRAMRSVLDSVDGSGDLPLGGTSPLHALFYLDRLDFLVSPSWLEEIDLSEARSYYKPVGSPDRLAGVPVLIEPDDVRARFPRADTLLIAAGSDIWTSKSGIGTELKAVLRRESRDVCGKRCGNGLLLVWTPADDAVRP